MLAKGLENEATGKYFYVLMEMLDDKIKINNFSGRVPFINPEEKAKLVARCIFPLNQRLEFLCSTQNSNNKNKSKIILQIYHSIVNFICNYNLYDPKSLNNPLKQLLINVLPRQVPSTDKNDQITFYRRHPIVLTAITKILPKLCKRLTNWDVSAKHFSLVKDFYDLVELMAKNFRGENLNLDEVLKDCLDVLDNESKNSSNNMTGKYLRKRLPDILQI